METYFCHDRCKSAADVVSRKPPARCIVLHAAPSPGGWGPRPGPGCVSTHRQSPQHLTPLPCPATGMSGGIHPVPILQKGVWPRIPTQLSSGHHRKFVFSREPRVCALRMAASFHFPKSHAWVQTPRASLCRRALAACPGPPKLARVPPREGWIKPPVFSGAFSAKKNYPAPLFPRLSLNQPDFSPRPLSFHTSFSFFPSAPAPCTHPHRHRRKQPEPGWKFSGK